MGGCEKRGMGLLCRSREKSVLREKDTMAVEVGRRGAFCIHRVHTQRPRKSVSQDAVALAPSCLNQGLWASRAETWNAAMFWEMQMQVEESCTVYTDLRM
jgi:hypothetical protein